MNQYPLLQAFGLDTLLTGQDDPALWEMTLKQYWKAPDDPACMVDALRFDVGRRLGEGEQPQGETNQLHQTMRGMVDVEEWCFERVDPSHLRVKTCPANPPVIAPAILPGMGLQMMIPGQLTPPTPPVQLVFEYLGITRPSLNTTGVVVYSAISMPGVGQGTAWLWQRDPAGSWHQTDQRIAWWIT
ncbi:MAG: hypothetical protein GYA80_02635 [Chloroflexi bacterium]|nr:hypothetical protein [Chloroflexota bacterium]